MGSYESIKVNETNVSLEKQLFADMADDLARSKPNAAYAYLPVSPDGFDQGFRKVSYRQFANAVNGLAWWLTMQLGGSLQAITYAGPNDIRQNAMIIACAKANYKLLLMSPRLQLGNLQSLLAKVDCSALVAADPKSSFSVLVQEAYDMPCFQVPTLNTLLEEEFPYYPPLKTFEECKNDPLVVLHTSGTTAAPSPITYTHDWVAAYIQAITIDPRKTDPLWELKDLRLRGIRLLVMMPPQHAANLFCTSFLAIAGETTIILPPANLPPTVEAFIGTISSTQVDAAFIPPHFISQIANNQAFLNTTSARLETLFSAGGKIVDSHGDLVASHIDLMTLYGATEVGSLPDYTARRSRRRGSGDSMWGYIRPHESAGWQFRVHEQTDKETIYEAWITRRNISKDKEPPVFKIYRDQDEYCTRDLFVQHPSIPGFWKWHGRMDDTIALSTGANVNPFAMEDGLVQNSEVQAVLMVGSGHPRPVLLVEPTVSLEPGDAEDDLRSRIWASVEVLNQQYCADHRVIQKHVIIAKTKKPLVRSLKGIVRRNATVKLYKEEIDELFH